MSAVKKKKPKLKNWQNPCSLNYVCQCDFDTSEMKHCRNKLMTKLRGTKRTNS